MCSVWVWCVSLFVDVCSCVCVVVCGLCVVAVCRTHSQDHGKHKPCDVALVLCLVCGMCAGMSGVVWRAGKTQ